ncbi:MAG: GIY-YIG nuclease family protein [Parcubacteria group bacterium]|nr:GIY-YIG nuclease family protein [Parcubacteria group bacterium]
MKGDSLKEKAKKFPECAGVYLFKDAKGRPIYVGRAGSLKKRIASYFLPRADRRVREMVSESASLSFLKTDTLLEAVILEAKLIKKYWPKFNVRERDDRSFVYLFVDLSRNFPRPVIVRGREAEKYWTAGGLPRKTRGEPRILRGKLLGPFQSYRLLKTALGLARKAFPFSVCSPTDGRACFHYQIGLCPGVCVNKADMKEYRENVKNLVLFFKGEKKKLFRRLKRDYPEKIAALKQVEDAALLSESKSSFSGVAAKRVEGYDISHFFGKEAVGAMVVFTDGEKDPSQYRLFKIRGGESVRQNGRKGGNYDDAAMLREVLERRLNHREWPFPDVVFVDGGLNQVRAAKKVLAAERRPVPVVGLAKSGGRSAAASSADRLIVAASKKSARELLSASKSFFQAVRDEAHRFAITFNKKRRTLRL